MPHTGFTSLPLLLVRGPVRLAHPLLQWIQGTFDCHVTPSSLNQEDLVMLVGQYATAEKGLPNTDHQSNMYSV